MKKLFIINISLLFHVLITIGCSTTKLNNYVQNIGIEKSEEEYNQLRLFIGDNTSNQYSLYEITETVETLSSIFGGNAVSIPTTNIPIDLTQILQKYGFYDYVLKNIDWIIFCPRIFSLIENKQVYGITQDGLDYMIYPRQKIIMINTFYKGNYRFKEEYVATIIHEVAHKEFALHYRNNYHFLNNEMYHYFTERYAYLKELEYLNAIKINGIPRYFNEKFNSFETGIKRQIMDYNSKLGLSVQNINPLPQIK